MILMKITKIDQKNHNYMIIIDSAKYNLLKTSYINIYKTKIDFANIIY